MLLQFPGGPPRTLEDMKDRYYSIARKLLTAREGTDATLLNNPLLRQPYNAAQERARRSALHTLLTRNPDEEDAENQVRSCWWLVTSSQACRILCTPWQSSARFGLPASWAASHAVSCCALCVEGRFMACCAHALMTSILSVILYRQALPGKFQARQAQ